MQKLKLTDMMSLSVETFSGEGFDFTEFTLTTWCSPDLAVQFFAFNGLAYNKSKQVVHIEDWDKIPPQVLKEAKQTLFTGYTSFLHGTGKPEADGSYLFHCVGAEVTVKDGMISMPDPRHIKKKATNLRRTVLF